MVTAGPCASRSWSRLYTSALLGPLAEQLVDAAGISAGMRVLDVLAGSGELSRRLAAAVAGARDTGRAPVSSTAEAGPPAVIADCPPFPGAQPDRSVRRRGCAGELTAVVPDGEAAAVLGAELRAARGGVEVATASPTALPFADAAFDVSLSLLRITCDTGGIGALGEMERVATRATAVVEGDVKPAPENLLAAAWLDVTAAVPAPLGAPRTVSLPRGWTETPMSDIARFDGEDQLTLALLGHHGLTPDADLLAALRARFGELLQPFQRADGTLCIPVSVRLLAGPHALRAEGAHVTV